ncbi:MULTISPECIES: nuclease-related domain-containing protein [unclassified Paenibacillus]|uniref:nuclease-related domain-containing protein n=1 Tax=unclassified Paenibacillus TaxID=185978 RepID=UPI002786CA1E|nr:MULTISPECIES: nuclease-related domain-containing protein [unclassified Paenibacillus]MDQ0896338.1 hypothetical protein [Paenibacillus sp. V4I7]MDQ0914119.1 hypothetical protein [Paenibacillus sp. V4I5]
MNIFDGFALVLFLIGFVFLSVGILPKLRSFLNHYIQTNKEQKAAAERKKRQEIKVAQKEAANRAEEQVSFHLRYLDEKQYFVWNGVYVVHGGMRHEIDHLIVGSKGLIHVETKNYSGELRFTPNGIERTKKDSYGNLLKEDVIKDPNAQMLHHDILFQRLLNDNGLANVPILGVLCIANDRSTVAGKPQNFDVIKDAALISYIQDLPHYEGYSPDLHETLVRLIEKSIEERKDIAG